MRAAGIEPASSLPEVVTVEEVSESEIGLAAGRQRKSCVIRQPQALSGTSTEVDHNRDLSVVVNSWPQLPSHVREAISTLVYASRVESLKQRHTD